jgi:hypothetical protein
MYPLFAALLFALSLIMFNITGDLIILIASAVCSVLIAALPWYMFLKIVKALKDSRTAGGHTVNEYTFSDNGDFTVVTDRNGEAMSTLNLKNRDILKIAETKLYVLLYINKAQAFIISKADCRANDIEDLRRLYGAAKI